MSRERLYRTEAIVLKRTDFGEADRLLTLYTPGLGKIRAIAKGVRKPTSRKSGHVELFTHSQLLIAKGRELDIITQAETIHAFRPVREDLRRITYASYAAELVDKFTKEGIESRSLFDLLLAMLTWLGEATDLDLTARFFELRLLGYVGYRPQLFRCVECNAQIEPRANFFSPEGGGVVCPRCGDRKLPRRGGTAFQRRDVQPLSLNALKVLRFLQTRDYALCRRLKVSPESHRELERTMQRYITYLLERRLKSIEFLNLIRGQAKVAV
ncbi:MAG: DNA repair protein RecO [Anaerolineae bacterium]